MAKCQAITNAQWRHQQNWVKCCENSAAHLVNGVGLCGTHFNAGAQGPVQAIVALEKIDISEIFGAGHGQQIP